MEIYAEEFEAGLGLAVEQTFGVFRNPTIWVPGKCELKPAIALREVDYAINEWDETHAQDGLRSDDGSLSIQVCPGLDSIFFGAGGILTRRDRRHLYSFSAVEVVGDVETIYHRGLVVDSWELKAAKEEDLVIDLDCKGVWGEPGAPMVPNYANLPAAYILSELELWLNGQQRIEFDSLGIKGEHDCRDDIYGSTLYRQDITTQGRKLSVSLEGYRDKPGALRQAYRNQDIVSLVARWTRGASSRVATIGKALVWEYDEDQTRQTISLKALKPDTTTDALVWST